MMEQERRTSPQPIEVRATDSGPRLVGYAAVFNAETVIAGLFREVIAPGAFREAIPRDDVRALWNHDRNVVLGRTKSGTLALEEDSRGLRYEVTVNTSDPDAMAVLSRVQRGDVDGSSFAFGLDSGNDEAWDYTGTREGRLPLRTITRARLYDVSPVAYPAYAEATVSARATACAAATEEARDRRAYQSDPVTRACEARIAEYRNEGERP